MAELDTDTQLLKHNFRERKTRTTQSSEGADVDVECTDYCPAVFRNILNLENIDFDDYMKTVCGEEHLKRVISEGKSGNVFVSLLDDRFVTKILRKTELKVLLEMLPNYYDHLMTHKISLLSKLYGLHAVKQNGGAKVYFAVVSNVMKSNYFIHGCYDLKGTTIGRSNLKLKTHGSQHILKDEDFDFSFQLDPQLYHRLLQQIKCDCEFLEAEGIMDYSCFISIHVENPLEDLLSKRCMSRESCSSGGTSSANEASSSSRTSFSSFDTELSLSYLCSPSPSSDEKFGVEMAARARRIGKNWDGTGDESEEYYDVILNLGIVDIFERYSTRKRIEHVYKRIHYRSSSIGAVDPTTYSSRLQDFLSKVFQSEEDPTVSLMDPATD